MHNIRIVKITGTRSGKEWYKDRLGEYYAVFATPFEESDPYFGGSYLVYKGKGSSVASRIHNTCCEVITDAFDSTELNGQLAALSVSL